MGGGTIWRKVPIFKQEKWVRLPSYTQIFRAARAAFVISYKNGGRFGENCRFSSEQIAILYKTFSRCARGLYRLTILAKTIIQKTATNACLQTCAGRRFWQNDKFDLTELFMHGYKILKRDLDGNENFQKRKVIFLSFGIEGLT